MENLRSRIACFSELAQFVRVHTSINLQADYASVDQFHKIEDRFVEHIYFGSRESDKFFGLLLLCIYSLHRLKSFHVWSSNSFNNQMNAQYSTAFHAFIRN